MDNNENTQGLIELYQGEIFGEILFDEMLSFFDDADKIYKISVLLQLETETKARLRPSMVEAGHDLRELEASRNAAMDMVSAIKGKTWDEIMLFIRDAVKPAVEHYKDLANNLPAKYTHIGEGMVKHEQSIIDFVELEIAGKSDQSIDLISAQLINTLPCNKI
jgi:hypothetical protein